MSLGNVYHGISIRFGTGLTTSTAFGTLSLIQTIDAEYRADKLEVKNQFNQSVSTVHSDLKQEANIEYVCVDSASPNTGSAVPVVPTPGTMITISGGTSEINGTTWIVDSATERQINSDATKVVVRAVQYPYISA